MSFADPVWLFFLVLVPLVLLAQRHLQRRTRRYAVRFTAVDTLRAAAELPRSWRRLLPVVPLLLALALVPVALARPRVTHRVPIRDASLMLVLDHSGSMAAADVKPTRLAAAIRAANTFVDQVPSNIRVGAVTFSTDPDTEQRPEVDHAAARSVINAQQAVGGTDTGPALQVALDLLNAGRKNHAPAAIVLLSDGAANSGVSPITVAQEARQDHVPIYTVALGTPSGAIFAPNGALVPVPPDPQLMRTIAAASGGRSFDAQTADDLSSIYTTLGQKLSTVERKRDITVYVLVLAGLLLMITAVGSVRSVAVLP
jgi:Ca-activated chloride channel family protein